ncbi:FGGY-family carbohydrate kinase [Rhodospirillales bacterium]|nr:FGGY-family carbohydrate kinase [Rhodospirillales bacterium]
MQSTNSFIISFDLGTTSFKAALYDKEGNPIAKAVENAMVLHPKRGFAEQDPLKWWQQMATLVSLLLKETNINAEKISCIVFSAQMCGTIAIDAQDQPLTPALIWLDTRSEDLVRKKLAGKLSLFGYEIGSVLQWVYHCNGAPNLSGKDPFSKHLWIKEEQPEIWDKTQYCLDVKDFMLMCCTGKAVTSPDIAHFTWLYSLRTQQWSDNLIRKHGFDKKKLPCIAEPTSLIEGGLNENAAQHLGLLEGTPVAVGLGDVGAAALGSGAIGKSAPHLYFGTGNWAAAHIEKPKVSPFTYIGSISSAFNNRHLLIAAQESAGASIEKVCRLLCEHTDIPAFLSLAEESVAGANGLLFMPWLHGERAPVDNSSVRGGFLNMSFTTTRADMARAALEGVVYNQLWVARHLFKMAGNKTPDLLPVIGGLAQSDLIMQTLADAFARPVARVKDPQWAGTKGAFYCAATALGWYKSLDEACQHVEIEKTFIPDEKICNLHQRRFKKFIQAYKYINDWHR